MVEATIHKVRNRPQYVVQFRGYAPTERNINLYRTQYFATMRQAREFANRRILDAMGIF